MWRSSVRAWRSTPVKVRDLCSFFSRVSRPYHVRKYSDMVGLTPSLSHPLRGEKMRQFLTSDKETIVCVHSTAPVDISGTKPLRKPRPEPENSRSSLSVDEANLVRQLRYEDPGLWTVSVLSKLFNAKRTVISNLAPSTQERKVELEKTKEILRQLKPYKRRIYLAEQAMNRQKRLQKAIQEDKYNFPGKL